MCAAIFTALWLLVAPATDSSAVDDPDQLEAIEAWRAEDWSRAADAFGRAYDADPRPELLWAHAQALRKAGRCEAAIGAYERFLTLDPPPQDAEAARTNRDACRSMLPALPPPEPEVKAAPALLEPTPVAEQRRRADPLAFGLLAGGVAFAGAGVGLVVAAHSKQATGRTDPTEMMYRDDLARARTMNAIGIGALAVGGSLVLGSVLRFVLVRRHRRASVATIPGGIRGRF